MLSEEFPGALIAVRFSGGQMDFDTGVSSKLIVLAFTGRDTGATPERLVLTGPDRITLLPLYPALKPPAALTFHEA